EIPYRVIDTSANNTTLKHINIYTLTSYRVEPSGVKLIKVGNNVPKLNELADNSVFYIDYDRLLSSGTQHDVDRQILELIGSGVPLIFYKKLPEFLANSPVKLALSEKALEAELEA